MEPYMLFIWRIALTVLVGIGTTVALLSSLKFLFWLLDSTCNRAVQLWAFSQKLPYLSKELIALKRDHDNMQRALHEILGCSDLHAVTLVALTALRGEGK